jgi:hypothetical protein
MAEASPGHASRRAEGQFSSHQCDIIVVVIAIHGPAMLAFPASASFVLAKGVCESFEACSEAIEVCRIVHTGGRRIHDRNVRHRVCHPNIAPGIGMSG